ncbi:MAG: hypothetical protein AAB439_00155 [Patescibacteria group bacterium]
MKSTRQEARVLLTTGNHTIDGAILIAIAGLLTSPLWASSFSEAAIQLWNGANDNEADTTDDTPATAHESQSECPTSPSGVHEEGPEQKAWDGFFNDGTKMIYVNCKWCGEFIRTTTFE